MKRFLLLAALVLVAAQAQAALEWNVGQPLELGQAPLDAVSSPDGKRLFVLGANGVVEVFDAQGKREAEIAIPFKAESLSLSADGRRLYLRESGTRRLQVLELAERYTIPLGDAPFRGGAEAAVAVVVFSDFQ